MKNKICSLDKAMHSYVIVLLCLALSSMSAHAVGLDDYDYPYANNFESLTSLHDDVTDTDPTNDINGQADWVLEGDWGMSGIHNGRASANGSFHLDNNPNGISQAAHNSGQLASMNGFVQIPAGSTAPILSYDYRLILYSPSDKMYAELQVEGNPEWLLLRQYSTTHNQLSYIQETIDLSAYKGQSIRIRFRQYNDSGNEARLWTIDNFYIGEQLVDDYDYPYFNNLESVTSLHDDITDTNPANDINGQADWLLEGDWGGSVVWDQMLGESYILDNNPSRIGQADHNVGHLATMKGYVDIPRSSVSPVLTYDYQLHLYNPDDRMYVEVQTFGRTTWEVVMAYTPQHNFPLTTTETLDLRSYKGQSIRVRFRQYNAVTNEARLWTIDNIYIGELTLADYDFPYANNFENYFVQHDGIEDSDASNDINGILDWNIQAGWAIYGRHGDWVSNGGNFFLDNNWEEADQSGHNLGQIASMNGYVNIPASSINPVITYDHRLILLDAADRVHLDVQQAGSLDWETIHTYSIEQNQTIYVPEKLPLNIYKGQSIRFRFRQEHAAANGPRLWTIDNLDIYDVGVVLGDLDNDGIPDNIDDDRDGDGVLNTLDLFPDDPMESSDLDSDGIGDNADLDRDGDGVSNEYETLLGTDPNNATSVPPDSDGDGIPNILDDDRDGDGVNNTLDLFPDDPLESSDLDGDGIGDNADLDRDGDGISNEYETLVGTDPNNATSLPLDSDADGIPDTLDDDRDGDGVLNLVDLYPDDITRWQLAAVSHVTTSLQDTSVKISWSAVADSGNLAGYNIVRSDYLGGGDVTLNTGLVVGTEYIDSTVSNATAYRYQVIPIDIAGNPGASHDLVDFFVAHNNSSVSHLLASRDLVPVNLTWDSMEGFHYQIYRGIGVEPLTPLQTSNYNNYLDTAVVWSQNYRYQVSTIQTFTNPITSTTVDIEGPLSEVISVAEKPNMLLVLNDVAWVSGSLYELNVEAQDTVTLTGQYQNAFGNVQVSATSGPQTITALSTDGNLRLTLPAVANAEWGITVSDVDYPDHQSSVTVRIVKDTTPPTITLDGAAERTTQDAFMAITGTVVDDRSGIAHAALRSDRYPGQEFGLILGADNSLYGELPIEYGDNQLSVVATDGAGNSSSVQINVNRAPTLAPAIAITTPLHNSTVNVPEITLQGMVYTSQAAGNVRIIYGDQQQFATEQIEPAYPFTFNNILLEPGYNLLTVRVETPLGNTEAAITVEYREDETVEQTAPVISLTTSTLNTTISGDSFLVGGTVSSSVEPVTLTINGQSILLDGVANQYSFQHIIDLTSYVPDEILVTMIATDGEGRSTSKAFTLYRDNTPPIINVTTPGVQLPPVVNRVVESPYQLSGTITDAHLSRFSINGQTVLLAPTGTANSYEFSASLALPLGGDQPVLLEAWDKAGNQSSRDYIFNADVAVGIEIISPQEDMEYLVAGATQDVDIVARFSGLTEGHVVTASVGAGLPQLMTLDSNAGTTRLVVPSTDGEHTLNVMVHDQTSTLISQVSTTINFINQDLIPLQLLDFEPKNAQSGVEPNAFIGLYFNKAIDPALLQLNVRQTAHGLNYDLSGQRGADPMMDGNTSKLVEVHHDQSPVAGGLSILPGNRTVAFYPTEDFSYSADIFVDVIYNGEEMQRSSFKVRPLPTHVQGFVSDSLRQPLSGIEVQLPELGRTTYTNNEGSYSFGFGDSAENSLPSGRYRIVFNPARVNPLYGEIENWVNIEKGRLSHADLGIVPILNPEEPYRRIQSGQINYLAQNELQLDLTHTHVSFPNGRSSGDVHVQFTPIEQVPYRMPPSVVSHWLYAFQPGGISLGGGASVRIKMPALYGSYDYLPDDDSLVLIVGFNNEVKQLEAIGIGKVQGGHVISTGQLKETSLNYLGYVLKDDTAQAVMKRYELGEISLRQMNAELDRLAR